MEAEKMKQTPALKPEYKVAVAKEFAEGGWDTEVIDTKDILIPKILLMHPTSELVKKGTKSQGDIVKSNTGDLVAKRGESFEVIVFEKWKEWRIMEKGPTGRYEYVRTETWTPANDNAEWDYMEGVQAMRRDKTINFYGILASEVKTSNAFPIKLSFVRTGFKTGMKIADAYARALMDKQPPTRMVFKIGTELINGQSETYFAFTAEGGRSTTDAEKSAALKWRQVIQVAKKNNAIVDHDVDNEPVASKDDVVPF